MRSDPEGLESLLKLGFRHVPVVAVGDRGVMGDRLQEVADLVGVTTQLQKQLNPDELAGKLQLVLEASARYYRQVPPQHLRHRPPESRRDLRQLGFHIARIGSGYLLAYNGSELTNEYLGEDPPDSVQTGEDIAALIDGVLADVRAWHANGGAKDLQQVDLQTYLGTRNGHDFLERTTWHIAQHIRQLMVVAERLGFRIDRPLTDADMQGLPLPDDIWV